eukprot:CAMPEP_0205920910 /NCGR_PEP_ID=MMETSP1325-20131115/11955_1 /ASSEMBLY_ACC=CAM_ASM_000708 /TAXON_ID=236786 /ORGANISM="Florenciella sp., Strain RCC1007" /LENGTH=173 /DNA_ID=CAMNT_0053288651 /DNA_START=82 /DNA_END=601 /DNA_ORIENTATION=-
MNTTDEEYELGLKLEAESAALAVPAAARAWADEKERAEAEGRAPVLSLKFSLAWLLSQLESPSREAGIDLLISLEDSDYEHLDDVSFALAKAYMASGDLEAAQAHVCRLLRMCPGHTKATDLQRRILRKKDEQRERRQATGLVVAAGVALLAGAVMAAVAAGGEEGGSVLARP